MKESTRNIIRMHGPRLDRAVHEYLYFTQYDRYVVVFLKLGQVLAAVLDRLKLPALPFKAVYDRYHAKVVTYDDAVKILTLEEDVVVGPDPTERIIPYQHANQIILKEPDYIAVMDCPCRLARENPCLPVDVCVAVGRTTAQFWLEHGARLHARRISQEEALDILKAGHERGHITTSWFKVATGGRTGVICSCCTCCCGGLQGMRIARALKGGDTFSNMIPSGYSVVIDPAACVACGECERVCIFGAATSGGTAVVDQALCMGCGLCVERCAGGARSLERDDSKGYPLDMDFIKEELGGSREDRS